MPLKPANLRSEQAMKYLFLFFCLILCSCEKNSESPFDGCDLIERTEQISFNEQEGIDSAFVYASSSWYFTEKFMETEECKFIKPVNEPNYCNENYCNENKELIMKIECPWVIAKKTSDTAIFISVKQNNAEKTRRQYIYIEEVESKSDVCVADILIAQCPAPIELSNKELLFNAEGGIDSVTVATNRSSWLPLTIEVDNTIAYYGSKLPYIEINGSWFTINRPDEKKIIFFASKNETRQNRSLGIILDAGNCSSRIDVIQSAD